MVQPKPPSLKELYQNAAGTSLWILPHLEKGSSQASEEPTKKTSTAKPSRSKTSHSIRTQILDSI